MGDKVINLREIATIPNEEFSSYTEGKRMQDLEVLSSLLKPVFPMHKMLAWSAYQDPDNWNKNHPAQYMLVWSWWACVMLVVSLIMTVCIYIFLVITRARQRGIT